MTNETKGVGVSAHSNPTIPMKKLTPQEMREKRDKGLYFYYNEKYVKGHKCQSQRLFRLEIIPDKRDDDVEWSFNKEAQEEL